MKSFIDCHCHAFNLVDVPMYLTLSDKLKMGTLGRLKISAGALIYLPKFIADKNLLKKKLEGQKEFVLFFERSLDRKNLRFFISLRSIQNDISYPGSLFPSLILVYTFTHFEKLEVFIPNS